MYLLNSYASFKSTWLKAWQEKLSQNYDLDECVRLQQLSRANMKVGKVCRIQSANPGDFISAKRPESCMVKAVSSQSLHEVSDYVPF